MMNECPKCGSTEIIPDLVLWTNFDSDRHIVHVSLDNPEKKRDPEEPGLRVDVCGACGYSELRMNLHEELLSSWKNGFKPRQSSRPS